MTSKQKIDLTLRAALLVKEAAGLINCNTPFLIKMTVQLVAKQLKELNDKCEQYEKENRK